MTIDSFTSIGEGISTYPLPDPALPDNLSYLWITQNGSDYKIDPLKLGYAFVGSVSPTVPFLYQLWWNTSVSPIGLQYYNGADWIPLLNDIIQFVSVGTSIAVLDGIGVLILDGVGPSNFSIVLPETPRDGQVLKVTSALTIPALQVSAPDDATTVLNGPTSLTAGAGISFIYKSSNDKWYRLS